MHPPQVSSLALWPFPALAAEKDKEIIKSAAKALHELQETLRSVPSKSLQDRWPQLVSKGGEGAKEILEAWRARCMTFACS